MSAAKMAEKMAHGMDIEQDIVSVVGLVAWWVHMSVVKLDLFWVVEKVECSGNLTAEKMASMMASERDSEPVAE